MNKKSKFVLVFSVLLVVIAVFSIVHNYQDNERNVYIAFFKQFESVPNMKDVAFMSILSTCRASPNNIKEASESLFSGFVEANGEQAKLYDISIFSSMVNVVAWHDTKKYKEMPNVLNMKSEKNILQISQIGFNKEKNQALICMVSNHSASIVMFKKLNSTEWELYKDSNIWIT